MLSMYVVINRYYYYQEGLIFILKMYKADIAVAALEPYSHITWPCLFVFLGKCKERKKNLFLDSL